MTVKTKYSRWRKKWRARPFEEGYIETKAFLSPDDHARVVEIARDVGARIPMLLGQMIGSYVAAIDGTTSKAEPPASNVQMITPTLANIETLSSMVIRSRFKGDTGAARFRQVAFINMINAELAQGNRPIARSIALSVDSDPSQIEALAKTMEARGVICRISLPGVSHSRAGKVLTIRDDAVECFNTIHKNEVGPSLLPPFNEEQKA